MTGINIFNSIQMLEPHCPGCQDKVEYGVSTEYDEKRKKHICRNCGHVFK